MGVRVLEGALKGGEMSEAHPSEQPTLFLTGLSVRNVMAVRAIELRFDPRGGLVVIGGENAQGKSSLLYGLEMAVEGAAGMPAKALRAGAEKGHARAEVSDRNGKLAYIAERVVTPNGTTLRVTDATGERVASPQALMTGFLSAIGFDPLEFARMAQDDPKRAAETLRKMAGLDFADLEQTFHEATEARKLAKRDAQQAEAQLAGMPKPVANTPLPDVEVSVADLTAQLEAAQAEEARRATVLGAALDAIADASDAEARWRAEQRAVEEAQARLAAARAALDDAKTTRAMHEAEAREVEALPPVDVDGIRAQLAASDATNRAIREKRAYMAKRDELLAHTKRVDEEQRRIEDAREAKRKRIAEAQYPIDGLGFDELGNVTLNGLPFESASDAERVRTSIAIGMALNPTLRCIVIRRGANDLDKHAIESLRELAKDREFLVLAERVGDGEEVSVVIEAGEVIDDRRHVGALADG